MSDSSFGYSLPASVVTRFSGRDVAECLEHATRWLRANPGAVVHSLTVWEDRHCLGVFYVDLLEVEQQTR
jgi:hypothetical protein